MSPRLGWVLAGCLAVALGLQLRLLLQRGPGFATLPVFVPASLEHERAMREARGQPAGRGGEEALRAAEALLRAPVDPSRAPAQRDALARVRATREALLQARNRRHALNIALMDMAVEVARDLSPEQWDAIHMRRDALRGKAEAELFSRVEAHLRGAGAPGGVAGPPRRLAPQGP
jgi:hypothetical protein